jgi:hypothetical protein
MKSVVGIFESRQAALRAAGDLRAAGLAEDRINVISPGEGERLAEKVPVDHGERPGVGTAIGAVAGAASGAQLGLAAASLVVPGVGPVIASGIAAAALLGLGGAAVGGALETALSEGVPRDDLFLYEEALRRGKSLVIALVESEEEDATARRTLEAAGAESLDAAREAWWLGLRDAEAKDYGATGRDFSADERSYRCGFEIALDRHTRGKSYEETLEYLRRCYPDVYGEPSFRRGYERGRAYGTRPEDTRPDDRKAA